jgi:hypothetical protein
MKGQDSIGNLENEIHFQQGGDSEQTAAKLEV